jgi:holo-[acyl-carrier protein] synthase
MAQSIGIDIAEIARYQRLLERYRERFLNHVLGPEEQNLLVERRDAAAFVAGRFAAKEAIVKAFGEYLTERPPLRDIQILYDTTGRPQVHLPDSLRKKLPGIRILVSISHEKNYAVGMAICMEKT